VEPPTPAAPPQAVTVPDECTLIAGPGEPVVTVGLHQRVDPSHAPHPSNDSERLVFRQLYETLVSADCMGRARAGLASSWRLDGDGRTWIVTLRQDARFSDGSPVTAADVRASWTGGSVGGELLPHVSRLLESVAILGERDLAIALRHHRADAPLALAHADLAVAKPVTPVAGSSPIAWPLGTRSGQIALDGRSAGSSSRGSSESRGASVMTITRDGVPALRLLIAPGDPRDLLDRDVDLLITRDRSTLDYARTLPQFQSVPMAWRRMYVLIMPGRAGSSSSPSLSDDARQALAIDAIRGEARGARGPFWWETPSECGDASSVASSVTSNQSSLAPRIVYNASDDAARDLAERLVGIARASGPAAAPLGGPAAGLLDVILPDRPHRTYQRAAGLGSDALATARRLGRDAGYIVAIDSLPVDPCRDLRALVDMAPWLDPATIVPLVETRLQAVVRRGRIGITSEWDGGLLIAGANPAPGQR
jgi:Bacterial extracellular solute-binding proteins, family 5 Middle